MGVDQASLCHYTAWVDELLRPADFASLDEKAYNLRVQ